MSNSQRENRVLAMQLFYQLDLGYKSEVDNEYVNEIKDYFDKNQEAVDSLIEKSLTGYTLKRLSYVSRAIVRVSTIEMLRGLAPSIAINEALEIVKEYADDGSLKETKFINKLLDTIKDNLK